MYAVTRSYSGKGARELIDVLEKNKADIERLIKSIKAFVGYFLVRTPEGGFSVSVFQDKAGAYDSVNVARDWIAKNAGNIGVAAPTISEGVVILHVTCASQVISEEPLLARSPVLGTS